MSNNQLHQQPIDDKIKYHDKSRLARNEMQFICNLCGIKLSLESDWLQFSRCVQF